MKLYRGSSSGSATAGRSAVRQAPEWNRAFLAAGKTAIEDWLKNRRWYRSKENEIREIEIRDWALAGPGKGCYVLFFLQAAFDNKDPELYFIPLKAVRGGDAPAGDGSLESSLDGKRYVFTDAFLEDEFNDWLLAALEKGARLPTSRAAILFRSGEKSGAGLSGKTIKLMKAEQSNTSLLVGKQAMLKVLRKVDPGTNPEVEMLQFLTRRGFRHVPQYRADILYEKRSGLRSSLGIVVDYVQSESDGWTYALKRAGRFFAAGDEAALSSAGKSRGTREDEGSSFFVLGRLTAEMHLALASDPAAPDFAPEPVQMQDIERWVASHQHMTRMAFGALEKRVEAEPGKALRRRMQDLLRHEKTVRSSASSLKDLYSGGVQKIRYHGDYHLGQVLKTSAGWTILDFEGEPLRSLEERKFKACPLKDTAGMLRSFSYAAAVAAHRHGNGELRELQLVWEDRARKAFLEGYFGTAFERKPLFLPPSVEEAVRLLAVFEMEKAVYELYYELNNRPEWVAVPMEGLERLLARMGLWK